MRQKSGSSPFQSHLRGGGGFRLKNFESNQIKAAATADRRTPPDAPNKQNPEGRLPTGNLDPRQLDFGLQAVLGPLDFGLQAVLGPICPASASAARAAVGASWAAALASVASLNAVQSVYNK